MFPVSIRIRIFYRIFRSNFLAAYSLGLLDLLPATTTFRTRALARTSSSTCIFDASCLDGININGVRVVDPAVDGENNLVGIDVVGRVADDCRSVDPASPVEGDLLDHSPDLGSRAKDGADRRHGDGEVGIVPSFTLSSRSDERVDLLGCPVLGDKEVPQHVVGTGTRDRPLLRLRVIVVDVPVTKLESRSSFYPTDETSEVVVQVSTVAPVGSKSLLARSLETTDEPGGVSGALFVRSREL